MLRYLLTAIILISAIPVVASATVCDDWNALEKEIRDSRIGKEEARGLIAILDQKLLREFREQAVATGHYFPVKGYGTKWIGGRKGNGYRPSGYDFYDGNRHGGHPAHDIFIRDRGRTGLDDATGRPAEIAAFASGVVVAVNREWEFPSGIRGGIYIWIFNPAENRFYYYAHLKKTLVAPGDLVKGGEIIALLGRTGKNAWPKRSPTHLHFMCLSFDNGRMTPLNTYRELTAAIKDR
jgi:murein DD-endopeptidase MepM/ murein hydrolase activator NlpD